MCGICGKYSFGQSSPEDILLVKKMCSVLKHRGPDDEGIYSDQKIVLGNRRLSIIDLAGGHQPIRNEDKTVWIVYNGEIYNYKDLTYDLQKKGHQFYTQSDTEVIIHLYEEYKFDFINYLNGIFVFALWDSKKDLLILARDRLGIKPLFYYLDDNKLVFASEIKAILQDPLIKKEVNLESLHHYLSLNYVPSPLTIFKGIQALPAGYLLISQNKKTKLSKYWDVSFGDTLKLSEQEIIEELESRIGGAVKLQLVSDVPVGAFSSGGIDSSAILAFMSEFAGRPIKTFNVYLKEPSFDESYYSKMVSRHFATEHYDILCEPGDLKEYLPKISLHSDNLIADISLLPSYMVSKLASSHVKVALSGDGGDELFAGYPTYLADKIAAYYRRFPHLLKRKAIPYLVKRLPISYKKMSLEFAAKRFIHYAALSCEEAHYSWRLIFSESEKRSLYSEGFYRYNLKSSFIVYNRFYEENRDWDNLSRHQYADMKVWLADSILAKVDCMSMANSLEVRVPFLDHTLVEFMAKMPSRFKLKGIIDKYILRRLMKNKVPAAIINRKKSGFNIPLGAWFRNELKVMVTDIISKDKIKRLGFFNWHYIEGLLKEHFMGRKDNGYKILSLMHFLSWYDNFISGQR